MMINGVWAPFPDQVLMETDLMGLLTPGKMKYSSVSCPIYIIGWWVSWIPNISVTACGIIRFGIRRQINARFMLSEKGKREKGGTGWELPERLL